LGVSRSGDWVLGRGLATPRHQLGALRSAVSSPAGSKEEPPAAQRFSYISIARWLFSATLSNNLPDLQVRGSISLIPRGFDAYEHSVMVTFE